MAALITAGNTNKEIAYELDITNALTVDIIQHLIDGDLFLFRYVMVLFGCLKLPLG